MNPAKNQTESALSKDRIDRYWSAESGRQSDGLITRWWQCPGIIRHINKKVCGVPHRKFSQGIGERAKQIAGKRCPFATGISVGCGNGSKEMALIIDGLVSKFHLFEFSKSRIENGRKAASRLKLEDKVTFFHEDALETICEHDSYDFVHWNNALHHMQDVEAALEWSRRILREGGMFYMDDYVGPSRFQWTNRMLGIASNIRKSLPEKYLVDPYNPGAMLPTELGRPTVEAMINADPSEAADSERIIEYVEKFFPDAEITLTGGVIYHLALSDILNNIVGDPMEKQLLEILMTADDRCLELGDTHYATALALG